jgi:hypothetical protein
VRCEAVRRKLSSLRDGALDRARDAAVRAHLEQCAACAARWDSLTSALDALAQAPRCEPPESLAQQVLNRLELERRGPGLALMFRPLSSARPLIFPSLLPAALVVLAVLAGAIALDRTESLPRVYVRPGTFNWTADLPGTENYPFVAGLAVDGPRHQGLALPAEVLAELSDGTFFLETVVARDGTVSHVTLIEGDAVSAGPLMEALRRQRFVPARYQGRPVAVSMYRLISRMDVRAPIT